MALSTTILQQPVGESLTAKTLKALLECVHDDTPIKIKIGDTFLDIREWRQVSGADVGPTVLKVLVPVDFTINTK